MQTGPRDKRLAFKKLKKQIEKELGGKENFHKLFPKPEERKDLYNAILYSLKINGGEKNIKILQKYKKAKDEILKQNFNGYKNPYFA